MDLTGKTVSFLGDSITEGVGVSSSDNRYDNRLKAMLNLKRVYNYGIGGTRLAHQSVPSEKPRFDLCFCGRAYDIAHDSDLIVVYGGVNDWIHGDAYFGEMTDNTPVTFCGAVEFILNLLKCEYPDTPVVFMTPAHACFGDLPDSATSNRPMKKADAKPLCEYVKVIEQKCRQHSVPVLNLYEKLGIDPNDEAQRAEYTVDGLHFNDKGHGILAERLAEFLKSL